MSLAPPKPPRCPLYRHVAACTSLVPAILVGCGDAAAPPGEPPHPSGQLESSTQCNAGERPAPDGPCVPVGPGEPGPGFLVHPDGWGHIAVKPTTPCEGTRRAKLGHLECIAVDDASRPFPPADTYAIVSTTDGLTSAMASASPDSVIALLPGTYAPFKVEKAVRLVGKSPEEVVIQGPGTLAASSHGITIATAQKVTLESMTVRGFGMAVKHVGEGRLDIAHLYITDSRAGLVAAFEGTRLSVRNTVVEGPDPERDSWDAIGVSAFFGASVELEDVDVRRYNWAISARYPGSTITAKSAVVQFEQRWPYAAGIEAWGGANVTMEDSAMSTREGRLVALGAMTDDMSSESPLPPGSVHLRRSVLEQRGSIMDSHSVIDVYQGARLELDRVSLRHEAFTGIGVSDPGSSVAIRDSLFSTTESRGSFHSFVITQQGRAEVSGSAFVGARQVAFLADGSSSLLAIDDSLVTGTKNYDGSTSGAVTAIDGGRVTLNRSTLDENEGVAVSGIESATVAMTEVLVQHTRDQFEVNLGVGVAVEGAQLVARSCKIVSNDGSGLFMGAGSGVLLLDSTVERNPVGILRAEGTDLQVAKVEPSDAAPGTAVLYRTSIQDNSTPDGVGTIGRRGE
jgi:hypothetical protein